MSQKHADPGSNPGWGTISASTSLATRSGNATGQSRLFFNNLRCGNTGTDTARQPDRQFAVRCLLQQFLSSKGQDSGPSIHGCRSNSIPAGNTKGSLFQLVKK